MRLKSRAGTKRASARPHAHLAVRIHTRHLKTTKPAREDKALTSRHENALVIPVLCKK